MEKIAVIDTETNWADQVMSIGTVVADGGTFRPLDVKYHVLPVECEIGGFYYDSLFLETPVKPTLCTRKEAMEELCSWLGRQGVRSVFAYNARFDCTHLPELRKFLWRDIMTLAIYRQTNPKIPATAELYATGRLKRGYGVEPILRLLSEDNTYRETHNALLDALDELEILRLLGHAVERYKVL